ncbi:hypothetical protein GCM10009530_18350 [Microbispora corallina]|uniref:Uncharacterized protein n=1 Tax=Microbispora corallina TaxID=83302 RepID=A0ABQ4FUR4_9ACTN|nr:hypothetical protein [Microbispora corallina]GIH38507.1 hypothetical protein Mco01_15070 [Microbispora corallina]
MPPARPRQPYALLWWALAAGVSLQALAGPCPAAPPPGDTPGWTLYAPPGTGVLMLAIQLADAAGLVTLATPVALALLAWAVAVRGPGRPATHVRAAAAGVALVAAGYASGRASALLAAPADIVYVTEAPGDGWLPAADVLAPLLGPALLVMAAARAGIRPGLRGAVAV